MDRRLYEEDFYLWAKAQGQALRAEGGRSGSNAVDWELVAEEIDDLGGNLLRECLSRTRTIIEHLYKLSWSGREEPRKGWRNTIRVQRADIQLVLTPSIRKVVESRLDELHAGAGELAAATFADYEPETVCDLSPRWSLPQILGEAEDPLHG